MSVGFVRYRRIEAVERDGNKAALYQVSQFRAAWQGARLFRANDALSPSRRERPVL
jgi:hypothetical protein